jgi:hypothetical protein
MSRGQRNWPPWPLISVFYTRSRYFSIQVAPHLSSRSWVDLCGLVVRVPGYRSRDPGFDSRLYQIFWEVVGLERGPLSLVSLYLTRKPQESHTNIRLESCRYTLCYRSGPVTLLIQTLHLKVCVPDWKILKCKSWILFSRPGDTR